MARFWIGVVSENHVKIGVKGGFCQVCHGKGAPLRRMNKGDYLLYYSPKIDLKVHFWNNKTPILKSFVNCDIIKTSNEMKKYFNKF